MSMMMPEGPPAPAAGPFSAPPEPEGQGGPADLYQQIISLLSQAQEVEDSEQDKLALEKVRTLIQQLLADEEREEEEAMAGKMSPGLLKRAYGG